MFMEIVILFVLVKTILIRIMIQIYDDFFSNDIRKELYDKLNEPHWHFKGGFGQNLFWHYDDLEKQEYFSEFLYKLICKKLNRKFKGINRIYANGQTAGQCGSPHFDDGDITFLYYPSPEWHITWQGHLIFLNDKGEGERIILHKPNRAILFSRKQKHYADAPSRLFNGLRISLAYKLWN